MMQIGLMLREMKETLIENQRKMQIETQSRLEENQIENQRKMEEIESRLKDSQKEM